MRAFVEKAGYINAEDTILQLMAVYLPSNSTGMPDCMIKCHTMSRHLREGNGSSCPQWRYPVIIPDRRWSVHGQVEKVVQENPYEDLTVQGSWLTLAEW